MTSAQRQLLAATPDEARNVFLRDALLGDGLEIFGRPESCVVATASDLLVVGFPEVQLIRAAALRRPSADFLVPKIARDRFAELTRTQGHRIVLFQLPPSRELVSTHPTRLLRHGDEGLLAHVGEELRAELVEALKDVLVATACEDGLAVAFCYSGYQTETLWDIGVDTLESHQRRGFASSAVAAMAKHMAKEGRRPVWCAAEDNPPSMLLAGKLGFEEVSELFVFPTSALA